MKPIFSTDLTANLLLESLKLEIITDESSRQTLGLLLNLIEQLQSQLNNLKAENQCLQDENNCLKGDLIKLDSNPNWVKSNQSNYFLEQQRKKMSIHPKSNKKEDLKIDIEQALEISVEQLPIDAIFKGYEEIIIQDAKIITHDVLFCKQKYYSPELGKTYLISLSGGYESILQLPTSSSPKALYLNLMKRCLSNLIYGNDKDLMRGKHEIDKCTGKYKCVEEVEVELTKKVVGGTWPSVAHTMIGIPRLNNLQLCVENVLANNIPGDLIETGVWRGGSTIFMRAILKAYGVTNRLVWVADSFEGLPAPNITQYPEDAGHKLQFHLYEDFAVPLEEVQSNFKRYGLLDNQVRFLKGWFRDTLPSAPIERLAVLRLDGDLYESTMDALVNLYPKLSMGGYVIIDDYGKIEACRKAVHDYREQHEITEKIFQTDRTKWTAAYWQRIS